MTDINLRAQRIADAVLKAKPAAQEPTKQLTYGEETLKPLRDLMAALKSTLEDRGAAARVAISPGRHNGQVLHDEHYSLWNNAGEHRTFYVRCIFKDPGMIPMFGLQGLDEQASSELASLQENGWIPAHKLDDVLSIVERFLTRFLVQSEPSSEPS